MLFITKSSAQHWPARTHIKDLRQRLFHSLSMVLFTVLLAPNLMPVESSIALSSTARDHDDAAAKPAASMSATRATVHDGSLFIGAYGGIPYTYPSDVRTIRPNGTDFTLHKVPWRGEQFKAPIYYGVRVAKWSDRAPFGAMLDFTHSKTISNRRETVRQSGRLDGQTIPPEARINDIFRKLEFSHGHNMLTLNGLYRLPVKIGVISPYMGVGAGISIPHTEVRFKGDLTRTYEYQYTGPAFQALFGLEFQLPKMSIFLEYKFTFADYRAPLTFRDGAWVIQDLWAQFKDWRAGISGDKGSLSTQLVSHQIIGGLGVRINRTLAH